MASSNDVFGFELLQRLYDDQIVKKEEIIILFVHWYLIKCGFRNIGTGDSKVFNSSDKGSELLPEGWNKQMNYTLRYIKDGQLYILHGLRSDEDLLLNILRCADTNISNMHLDIEQTVKDIHGPLTSLIPTYQTILQTMRTDLIEPISPRNTVDIHTQTDDHGTPAYGRDDPLRLVTPSRDPPQQPWRPEADPSNVGRADLDPLGSGFLGRGGGGMIFDPFRGRRPVHPGGLGVPGRLPPGAIPPGARFDPFGPPDINQPRPRRFPPDNDDLPPSGYDDMFM